MKRSIFLNFNPIAWKLWFTCAVTLIGLAAVALVYLVYPGTPSKSKVMAFEGFIELPRRGPLTVLDYLTLNNQALFVTSESSGALFKIAFNSSDLRASAVSEMPGAGSAHGVALLPDVNVAFITRSEANTVDVFDPRSLQQFASIPVADDADAILYIPSTKLIYVAHGDAKMATLIDPEKRATVGTIQLSGRPEFPALDSESGLLFQNLEDINAVAAIDVGKRSVVGQWPLAPCEAPSGMAIDSEQRRLFAVCKGNAKLVIFNLETHRVITSLGIGGGPDSVAFDRGVHRIYTTGKAGEMTVIQQDGPDSYRVLDEIHTHYGAHTLTVDPVSHRVFVAYASLLAHPRIAVFSPTPEDALSMRVKWLAWLSSANSAAIGVEAKIALMKVMKVTSDAAFFTPAPGVCHAINTVMGTIIHSRSGPPAGIHEGGLSLGD